MAVPEFQSVMLPLLTITGNGKDHSTSEVTDALALRLGLTEADLKERLPSGRQSRFRNRVGWALTHMKKAGLLESTGRGTFRITERGLGVLRSNPAGIDIGYLSRFSEYVQFRKLANRDDEPVTEVEKQGQTPDEVLEQSYQALRRALAEDLLERVKGCSPRFFEKLVVDLLVAMGYGGSHKDAGQAVGQGGDGGIDGIIKEDILGLDAIHIQAKRWEGTVGRPVVQSFAGSLDGFRAKKGVLITTSQFSADAKDYVTRIEKKIVLIDGEQLAQLMIDHGVGATESTRYIVKKTDLDYFSDE